MIIEFSLANYKSFKDLQTFPMFAAKIKSRYSELDKQNVFKINEEDSLVKSKAIYGANASGKSNLILAMIAMLDVLKNSITDKYILNRLTQDFFKLNVHNEEEPIFFQIAFIKEIEYRYGFTVYKNKIMAEWLFGVPNKREVYYFLREEDEVKINNKRFKEAHRILPKKDELTPFYRNNSLFLSVLAAYNGKIASEVYEYLISSIVPIGNNLFTSSNIELVKDSFSNTITKDGLNQIISNIDLNIGYVKIEQNEDISLKNVRKGYEQYIENRVLVIYRKKYDDDKKQIGFQPIRFDDEAAEGTKKMIMFSPFLFSVLENGGVLIIDEFDANFHPNLSRKIVQLFNSEKTNPKNAQLIFATHDSNFLDARLLRKDQICFVEKNKYGASSLISLAEYKGIRNDASFEKDYLKGKYGAIPYLNRFNWAFDKTE